ncbi:hypothetical protein HB777_09735 [Mesorhizobium loti]|nr:hypothetical protein HB777_09735 [Mesorhizobium loti]
MGVTEMTKKNTIYSWLDRAISNRDGKEKSAHLTDFLEYTPRLLVGVDFAKYVYDIVETPDIYLRESDEKDVNIFIVVYIPIGASNEINLFSQDIWQKLRPMKEPPSLYVFKSEIFFDENMEEYRRPISIPFQCDPSDCALFRSFRDMEAIAKEWEFTTGIYLIKKLLDRRELR